MIYLAPYADLKSNELEIEKLSGFLANFTQSIRCAVHLQHEQEVQRLFQRIQQCRRPLLKLRYLEILDKMLLKMDARIDCTEKMPCCAECQIVNQIRQKMLHILTQSSTSLLEQVLY
jgi:hypothetical protein